MRYKISQNERLIKARNDVKLFIKKYISMLLQIYPELKAMRIYKFVAQSIFHKQLFMELAPTLQDLYLIHSELKQELFARYMGRNLTLQSFGVSEQFCLIPELRPSILTEFELFEEEKEIENDENDNENDNEMKENTETLETEMDDDLLLTPMRSSDSSSSSISTNIHSIEKKMHCNSLSVHNFPKLLQLNVNGVSALSKQIQSQEITIEQKKETTVDIPPLTEAILRKFEENYAILTNKKKEHFSFNESFDAIIIDNYIDIRNECKIEENESIVKRKGTNFEIPEYAMIYASDSLSNQTSSYSSMTTNDQSSEIQETSKIKSIWSSFSSSSSTHRSYNKKLRTYAQNNRQMNKEKVSPVRYPKQFLSINGGSKPLLKSSSSMISLKTPTIIKKQTTPKIKIYQHSTHARQAIINRHKYNVGSYFHNNIRHMTKKMLATSHANRVAVGLHNFSTKYDSIQEHEQTLEESSVLNTEEVMKMMMVEDNVLEEKELDSYVSYDLECKNPYFLAVEEIKKMTNYETPEDKIECVVRTANIMRECISEYYKMRSRTAINITPDDLLSLFAYILTSANMHNLWAEVEMIDDFVVDNLRYDEPGYYIATLRAAMQIIVNDIERLTNESESIESHN